MRTRFDILLLVCLAGLPGAFADDAHDWPIRSEGDLEFQADAMIYREPGGITKLGIYLNLQEADLTPIVADSEGAKVIELEAEVTLLDARGRRLREIHSTLAMPADEHAATDPLAQRTISLALPLAERPSGCEILLRDLHGPRVGLIHRIRGALKEGRVRARLPRLPAKDEPLLAGPIFLRGYQLPDEHRVQGEYAIAAPTALRDALEPNPGRLGGLFEPTLTIYFELGDWPAEPTTLRFTITAAQDGSLLLEDETCLGSPAQFTGLIRSFNVGHLPAGSYRLTLTAATEESLAVQKSVRSFQVQWDPEAWQKPYRQRLAEAGLLMERDAWNRFRALAPGQQESVLDSLWTAQAGTPGQITELKRRFHERVELADVRYRSWRESETEDRGRVLVHFGEPDEIHKALHPTEEENLYTFLQEKIDTTGSDDHGVRPMIHPLDQSAYEVWYYAGRGVPLFPGEVSPVRGQTLKFIFVDDMGTGCYRLIYTNLFGGFG